MVQKKIGKRKNKPSQDLIDIKCVVSFENTGAGNVSAILLERKGKMTLRFAHITKGVHNDITFSEAKSVTAQLIELTQRSNGTEKNRQAKNQANPRFNRY